MNNDFEVVPVGTRQAVEQLLAECEWIAKNFPDVFFGNNDPLPYVKLKSLGFNPEK